MKFNKHLIYISLFAILYLIVAFSSFWHAVAFFGLANNSWMSIILAFAFEVGQAAVLFSLLTSKKDRGRIMPWVLMSMFTLVQVIGNVYSSYKYIITNSVDNLRYFKEPIFIWTDLPNDQANVIIVYLVGALLPIAALLLTSMITNYLTDIEENKKESTFLNTEGDSLLNQNSILNMENQGLHESLDNKEKELEKLKEELKSKQDLIDLQNQKINDLDQENQELVKEKFDEEPEQVLQQEFSIPTKSIEFDDEQNQGDLNKENEQGEDKLDNEGQRPLETIDKQTEKIISEDSHSNDEEPIKGEDTKSNTEVTDENLKVADALMGGNILNKPKIESHFINNKK